MFDFLRKRRPGQVPTEARAAGDATISISDATGIASLFNLMDTAAGEAVTIDSALGVPAVWAAVNFLSGTMAALPVHVYRRDAKGVVSKVSDDLSAILNGAVNDGMSSFDWRKHGYEQTFTGGRQCSFIERNAAGRIIAIWPLDPVQITIRRRNGRVIYDYRDGSRTVTYEASDIIDLPFMLKSDGLAHRSPIMANAEVIAMAQAATKYGGAFFRGGGVPPFAIEGAFKSPGSMQRAADDLEQATRKAAQQKRQALVLPDGLKITPIGVDAEKAQLVETQRFMVEQIARVYSLPPVFLQDLTHGTYSNAEQQDLHLVKHTISRHVAQFEGQLNLKLFGRRNREQFVKINLDGLLRGDFKTRMEGYAQGIQHGVLTPNEARDLEDRPGLPGGDKPFMQGAMMPIESLGQNGNEGGDNAE